MIPVSPRVVIVVTNSSQGWSVRRALGAGRGRTGRAGGALPAKRAAGRCGARSAPKRQGHRAGGARGEALRFGRVLPLIVSGFVIAGHALFLRLFFSATFCVDRFFNLSSWCGPVIQNFSRQFAIAAGGGSFRRGQTQILTKEVGV